MKSHLNITNYLFDPGQVLSISIELHPNGKYLIISTTDDNTLNITYIYQVNNDLPLFSQIPAIDWQNVWIIYVRSDHPII